VTQRAWDGKTYDRVGTPQAEWGVAVLDRLLLVGDETIADVGCGSGRVTEELVRRLPRGQVIAVDGSASMIAAARERLAGHDNVAYEVQDLRELDLFGRVVDGIVSTATFHWIHDHALLFGRLRAQLGSGATLTAQCGGRCNIGRVLDQVAVVMALPQFAGAFENWTEPCHFADAPETEVLLREAGFGEARCWLHDAPVFPPEPAVFLGSVILGAHLERLAADQHDDFVAAVLARLPEPFEADYVRLNIDAVV